MKGVVGSILLLVAFVLVFFGLSGQKLDTNSVHGTITAISAEPTDATLAKITPSRRGYATTSTPTIATAGPHIAATAVPSLQAATPNATESLVTLHFSYEIINVYPHDRTAFTQGLMFADGILYEGTGRYGQSSLRKVELETGKVLQLYKLPAQVFGEGITLFDDKIIQLTWKSGRGFIYDKDTFSLLHEFSYSTEGWGITHDGNRLIMSDGSSTLYYRDPKTLAEIDKIEVYDQRGPVVRLNELEYVHDEIYANIWQTNRIAKIDPTTGQITGWILLDGLLTADDLSEPVDVLNGVAYDPKKDRLFVTGKLWPKLFEIDLVPVEQ